MQLLGNLFEYVLEKRGQSINILGATFGDTGSAAEYAMRGKHNVKVFMLSPDGKMSAFQRAQMYSLQDPNIFNIAVTVSLTTRRTSSRRFPTPPNSRPSTRSVPSFDQTGRVSQRRSSITSRAISCHQEQRRAGRLRRASGNFGNICAGHIARRWACRSPAWCSPPTKTMCSTSSSRPASTVRAAPPRPASPPARRWTFPRLPFRTLRIRPGRPRSGSCARTVAKVDKGQAFDLSATVHWQKIGNFGFVSGKSSHVDRINTIRFAQGRYNVMLDTHTADGLKVALEHRLPNVPMIVLETAQPAKFEETIREALGTEPVRPADLAGIEKLEPARRRHGAGCRGDQAIPRRARLIRRLSNMPGQRQLPLFIGERQ